MQCTLFEVVIYVNCVVCLEYSALLNTQNLIKILRSNKFILLVTENRKMNYIKCLVWFGLFDQTNQISMKSILISITSQSERKMRSPFTKEL